MRVAKGLLDYGDRLQYSVFECDLTAQQMARMVTEVKGVINAEADSVRVYRLCAACVQQIQAISQAGPPAEAPVVCIV